MTDAILTDLDGVIRTWPRQAEREAEREAGLPKGAIPKVAFSDGLLELAITGQIPDGEWRKRIALLLSQDFPQENVQRAVELWSASPGKVDREVQKMLQACRKRVQLLLVSNATSRLLSDLRGLDIAEEFDYIINSSDVGSAKPDPGIYLAALDTAGVAPGQALFVDDNPGNVAGATRLGMTGHTYVGATDLREELCRLGCLK